MARQLSTDFHARRLERVFDRCFARSENTLLRGGADEPVYLPADTANGQHVLYYREDYFASALHEIAHWCIAGRARRQQVDFGYWYAPEGRSPGQQRAFEAVEVEPQALEWILARACGFPFRVSVDNFRADRAVPDTGAFRCAVARAAGRRQREGLPGRARQLFAALSVEFGQAAPLNALTFDARDIA